MAQNRTLICLITGANQGLGFEAAKALVQRTSPSGRPYHVLVGSRSLAKGARAADELNALPGRVGSASPLELEVTSETSAAAAAARVARDHGRLDVLVNNAGIPPAAGAGLVAALRQVLDTNLVGCAIVTEAFLPLLLAPPAGGGQGAGRGEDPRLVFVGSSMGSLAGAADPSGRYYRSLLGTSPTEYRVSKAGLNMLMLEYHKRYGTRDTAVEGETPGAGRRLRVWTADPGANATSFVGGPERAAEARAKGLQGPEVGARVLVGCVTGERDGEEGRMVGAYGVSPW